jgi:hypothetical protein
MKRTDIYTSLAMSIGAGLITYSLLSYTGKRRNRSNVSLHRDTFNWLRPRSFQSPCKETNDFQGESYVAINDDAYWPPAGQWMRVSFSVNDPVPSRIIVKQNNIVVARHYNSDPKRQDIVSFKSPGGPVTLEFTVCVGGQWVPFGLYDYDPLSTGQTRSILLQGNRPRWVDVPDAKSRPVVTITFGGDTGPTSTPPRLFADPAMFSGRRFDETYFVMQHNSFEKEPITDQLNQGLRAFEFDLHDKDWIQNPDGPPVSHDPPSNLNTTHRLGRYLRELTAWLDINSTQGPLLVFLELKGIIGGDQWPGERVLMLDDKLRALLGRHLFTADDLYLYLTGAAFTRGGKGLRRVLSETLDANGKAKGWPKLADLNGRLIVAYMGGREGRVNQTQDEAIKHIMKQPGRSLPFGFFCPDVGDDPQEVEPGQSVKGMSSESSEHVVGSNLKATDHYQVTANAAHRHHQIMHLWDSDRDGIIGGILNHVYDSHDFVFNYIAVAHGVSAIGRNSSPTETFDGSIPLVGRRRSLHGYFELQPMNAPGKRMAVKDGGTSNGTQIELQAASSGPNQQFVYTAEGQLRPKHANKMCTDIKGGRPENGKEIHIWGCSGGDSEKWVIEPSGIFRCRQDGGYCLTVEADGSTDGSKFVVSRYNGSPGQHFRVVPVNTWSQTEF